MCAGAGAWAHASRVCAMAGGRSTPGEPALAFGGEARSRMVEARKEGVQRRVVRLCRLEPREHQRGQLELEGELDALLLRAPVERDLAALPQEQIAERGRAPARGREEHVDGVDQAEGRSACSSMRPPYPREHREGHVELVARELAAPDEVLAEQLAGVARRDVVEAALLEVQVLAAGLAVLVGLALGEEHAGRALNEV